MFHHEKEDTKVIESARTKVMFALDEFESDWKFVNKPHSNSSAAEVLAANKAEVIDLFVKNLRNAVEQAKDQPFSILVDTLPAFIDNLVQALSPNFQRNLAADDTTVPLEHGRERARVTAFTPEEVVQEYQILRRILFQFLDSKIQLSSNEKNTIWVSLDNAMLKALTAYSNTHIEFRESAAFTITHDLRTPLTSILMNAGLIRNNIRNNKKTEICLDRIIEDAKRLDNMIQDLLNAIRIKSGEKPQFELHECEIFSVIKTTIEHLTAIYGDRFLLKGDPHMKGIVDCKALKRALENLILNAIKYGSSDTKITITACEQYGRAIISVHNWGNPIPLEKQTSIFETFKRLDNAPQVKKPGWGLGLTLVRGVAEGHGGSVAVDSTFEKGTLFTMSIPLEARQK